jgi:outer membrane receptor protein involved in Fe transport
MASQGYELNLTANPTRNWRLQLNYSYTDTKQVNFGPEVAAWMEREIAFWRSFNRGGLATGQGRTIEQSIAFMLDGYRAQADLEFIGELGTRKHKANVFTRYDFTWEKLKGAYVGGGYRYQSRNLAGSDVTTRRGFYGQPITWQGDALAGYKFQKSALQRVGRWVDGLTLQLNVSNIFDDDPFLITRILPDGVTVQRAVVQAPRTWRLQARFEF